VKAVTQERAHAAMRNQKKMLTTNQTALAIGDTARMIGAP
jgi:hypothetical protein